MTTRLLKRAALLGAALASLMLSVPAVPAHAACEWIRESSDDPTSAGSDLRGLAAIRSDDVWALGFGDGGTLAQHWDGTAWSRVPTPNVGTARNLLYAATARTSTDVWAVGEYFVAGSNPSSTRALILHWDGTSWSVIPSPNPGSVRNILIGVAIGPGGRPVAVGAQGDGGLFSPLIIRWTGTEWLEMPNPSAPATGELRAIARVPGTSVMWAVGDRIVGGTATTLTQRFSNGAWQTVQSPNVGQGENVLHAVSAARGNIWAVGHYRTSDLSNGGMVTMRWRSGSWSTATAKPPGTTRAKYLYGVEALPDGTAWAVGTYRVNEKHKAAVAKWDGTSWTVSAGPSPGTIENRLHDVTSVAGSTRLWAVGGTSSAPSSQIVVESLILRRC